VATAEGGAGPTSVTALTLRDWRGPFLGALAAAVRSGDVLDELLGAYDATAAPDTGLARGLLAAAAAAEVAESGLLARGFQRDVAAAAMGRFLDARADAAEGLEVLVRTAGAAFEPGGVRLIDSVETVQDIRGTGGALAGEIAGRLEGRIGRLEDTAVPRAAIEALSAELATKADASSLTRLGTRVDAALAAKLDAAAVDSLVTRLDVTESGLGTLTNRVQGLSGSLDGLRDTVAVIDPRRIAELESAISRLGTTIAEVDGRIKVTGDRLERLDQSVATLAGATVRADDIRDLRSEIETLRNGTAALSTDVRTLGTAVTGLRGELAGKADAQSVASLRSDVATLRTENQRLSTSVRNIDTRIGTLVIQPNRPPR
jgi:hypothetical protein